jgi:ADP-ribose pyrophosphatase YjhB (NUDIX family)
MGFLRRLSPIPCVDVLPYREWTNADGQQIREVGLIRRRVPRKEGGWTEGWALVGGRVYYNESLKDAIDRHVVDTLDTTVTWDASIDSHRYPTTVGEYFPSLRPGEAFDPRQHSIALSYVVDLGGPPRAVGEALEFRWFALDEIPGADIGFNQWTVVKRLLERISHVQPIDVSTMEKQEKERVEGLKNSREAQLNLIEVLEARRVHTETMMWQVPGFALAGKRVLLVGRVGCRDGALHTGSLGPGRSNSHGVRCSVDGQTRIPRTYIAGLATEVRVAGEPPSNACPSTPRTNGLCFWDKGTSVE